MDRLVAMLADLGQKGGMLKLVGKIALLWGGIRGAMSLTDRLISFLHIADRPLFQRYLELLNFSSYPSHLCKEEYAVIVIIES